MTIIDKFKSWKWKKFQDKRLHWPLVWRSTWSKEMFAHYQADKTIALLKETNDKERDRLADLISKFTRLQLEPPSHGYDPYFYLKIAIAPEIFYGVYHPSERDAMREFARYASYAIEREIMKIEIRYRSSDGIEYRRKVEQNWSEYDRNSQPH